MTHPTQSATITVAQAPTAVEKLMDYRTDAVKKLVRYRTDIAQKSPWKGRLITAGIILGALALTALAAGLIFTGVVSGNPILIGAGIALGSCVLIGTISYLSISRAMSSQGTKKLTVDAERTVPVVQVPPNRAAVSKTGLLGDEPLSMTGNLVEGIPTQQEL